MNHLVTITKSDGTKELFEEQKLVASLQRVGASAQVIDDIVGEVERDMVDGMSTADIYSRAHLLLKKHSIPTATRYSVRRALFELGPDGFPFERFISRIFKVWGYETLTDQILLGTCVSHEVDVVAWKGDELAVVEAKFHNEFDLKSDVKVALYIHARFEDISGNLFDYGGVKRKPTEQWLVTNTKFTDQAVYYGECKGIKMLGWNHPARGNLHEIIEQNGLYPVTCISGLTHQQKRDLIGRNVLTCADLLAEPDALKGVGIKAQPDIDRIVAEAKIIVDQAK